MGLSPERPRDPLHLFHANIFFPYRYTLAFSENDYGIAMLFFSLSACDRSQSITSQRSLASPSAVTERFA
ncbi:MAG: hypothetical protein H0V27_03325 [Pyrinomonadaceae bacterium]|nr:hypothetical protein [Pyrinomonadaceae bacterium]